MFSFSSFLSLDFLLISFIVLAIRASAATLSKFLRNLESRVYSQLSRDLVDSLFDSEGGGTGGSIMLEGNLITFTNTGTEIILTIVDVDGLETIISIPINSFGICTEDCEV